MSVCLSVANLKLNLHLPEGATVDDDAYATVSCWGRGLSFWPMWRYTCSILSTSKSHYLLTYLGRRRRVDCQRCDGPAAGNLLLSPLALASGRDGALYIGDYNYLRRLSPGRDDVATILQLR